MSSGGQSGGLSRAPDLERLASPPQEDHGSVELGTVGWDDRKDHFVLGTEDNDGCTLVYVTLYRGRDPNQAHNPNVCQGQQVIARLGMPVWAVPPKGSQVVLLRPAEIDGPGAWHIASIPGPNIQFRNGPKPGDVIFDGYAGNFMRMGADGTLSLVTTTDGTKDGRTVYTQVRRDGFRWIAPFGKLTYDQGGWHLLHYTGARMDLGGIGGLPSPLDTLSSYITLAASIVKLQASAIALGPDAGVQDNVPLYTPLLAILEAISAGFVGTKTAITAIEVAVAGLMNAVIPGSSTPLDGAVATALVAVDAAVAAIGAAPAVLPSQAVTVV